MNAYAEERQYKRYDYHVSMSLYPGKIQDNYYGTYLCNYSNGGMYLESSEPLDVGQHVYVKFQNYDPEKKGFEKYESYSGYVQWSNDLGTSSPGLQYGYGIKYKDPVYY